MVSKTLDGSVNDCLLLPDGVHLSQRGTDHLARGVGVNKYTRNAAPEPVKRNTQKTAQTLKQKAVGDTRPPRGSRVPANSQQEGHASDWEGVTTSTL